MVPADTDCVGTALCGPDSSHRAGGPSKIIFRIRIGGCVGGDDRADLVRVP